MSTHQVPVVKVKLEKHPNADTLSIVKINDYTCIVNTEAYKDVILGAWIPPDSLVDTSMPCFSTYDLKGGRVRAKKIRGIVSYGLLIPAPENTKEGEDVMELLKVEHYDPDVPSRIPRSKDKSKDYFDEISDTSPQGIFPKYDVENFQNYARKVFEEGELVTISEKIHGENARFVFQDGKQFCGSRVFWKKEHPSLKISLEKFLETQQDKERGVQIYNSIKEKIDSKKHRNKWWEVYYNTPSIKRFCEANPNYALYGEIYGMQGKFPYDASSQNIKFLAFDILTPDGRWLDYQDFIQMTMDYMIPCVPQLGLFHFEVEKLINMASGMSVYGKHIREGIVIKPLKERWHQKLGRVCLKIVCPEFLQRN